MGNELAQFQNRMSEENWIFLLTMLQRTTDQLLVKKKIDALMKEAKFDRQQKVDMFDPPAGSKQNILARIRSVERKPKKLPQEKKSSYGNMAFNFGTGKVERGVVSPRMLEALPATWTEESIKTTQENLKKLEAESKLKPSPNPHLDKKTEIVPPKPKQGEAWTPLNHWTVFGHLPNLNCEERREAIAKLTQGFKTRKLNERLLYFTRNRGIIGQILPIRHGEKRYNEFIKSQMNKEENNEKHSLSSEGNIISSSSPKAEGEVEEGKKKRKRKYKKRNPKT